MENGGYANDSYQISKVTSGLKDYYISKSNYRGSFGTKDVISPKGSGTDRFYIMTVDDVIEYTCNWNIATNLAQGEWSLPSKDDWAAFGGELGINDSNYPKYGLSDYYWTSSSSQASVSAYYINFYDGYIDYGNKFADSYYVRMSMTF